MPRGLGNRSRIGEAWSDHLTNDNFSYFGVVPFFFLVKLLFCFALHLFFFLEGYKLCAKLPPSSPFLAQWTHEAVVEVDDVLGCVPFICNTSKYCAMLILALLSVLQKKEKKERKIPRVTQTG